MYNRHLPWWIRHVKLHRIAEITPISSTIHCRILRVQVKRRAQLHRGYYKKAENRSMFETTGKDLCRIFRTMLFRAHFYSKKLARPDAVLYPNLGLGQKRKDWDLSPLRPICLWLHDAGNYKRRPILNLILFVFLPSSSHCLFALIDCILKRSSPCLMTNFWRGGAFWFTKIAREG